jgi:uncharacterized phage protein (TIGR02218 family)
MRNLPAPLQAHLDNGTTTIAWCWKIIRRDGVVLGFTNHDRNLVFGGTTYEASTGMLGTEIESSLGMSVDNVNVMGAVDSLRITEADINRGFYSDAVVEIYIANWADLSQFHLMKTGTIGEVKRGQLLFEAEVRGLATDLQQTQGRLFAYGCSAVLGDIKCGKVLTGPTYTSTATILTSDGVSTMIVSGLSSYASGWFSRGRATFTSGLNLNVQREIKSHIISEGVIRLDLWEPPPFPLVATDTMSVRAGCDKSFKMCKAKFANQLNYRGFPHIPGPTVVLVYANSNDIQQDGGGNYVGAD